MLRSIFVVISAVVVTALFSGSVVILNVFYRAGKTSRRIARVWAKALLYISGIKVQVIGKENVISDSPQIFMANHQSDFDILIFLAHCPADFLWTAKKELFRIPVFGRAMRSAEYIEIDRQDHKKAVMSLDLAAGKINEGLSIATFPEGTRSRDGRMLPFKQGMFHLALKTGAAIVPVSIIGSWKIMPKHSLKVRRGKIVMVIDRPVATSGLTMENRRALMEEVRVIISGNHDKYQEEVAN